MSITSIGVIGVGGVGGYFGGKLCQLLRKRADLKVSFLARGEHLRAIRERGLLLSSESDGELICRPSLVTDAFSQLPPMDLCLVCVKQFDLTSVLSGLASLVGETTIIMPLLNGVDIYSRVRSVIQQGIVLPACVYVGTHIQAPGRVVQRGGACRILFGPDPRRPDFAPSEVIGILDQAGVKSQWTGNVQAEIWSKFMFICGYGLISAANTKSLGEILNDAGLRDQVRGIMAEIETLAERSGVALPRNIVEQSLMKARAFPPEARPSFQRDFEIPDKQDERDLFTGAMIRMGRQLGIETPAIRAVAEVLEKRKPSPSRTENTLTTDVY